MNRNGSLTISIIFATTAKITRTEIVAISKTVIITRTETLTLRPAVTKNTEYNYDIT